MKYYVVVELHSYDGRKIAESSCTCEEDISNESIVASARIAGELMVAHHTGVPLEQKKVVAAIEKRIAETPDCEG